MAHSSDFCSRRYRCDNLNTSMTSVPNVMECDETVEDIWPSYDEMEDRGSPPQSPPPRRAPLSPVVPAPPPLPYKSAGFARTAVEPKGPVPVSAKVMTSRDHPLVKATHPPRTFRWRSWTWGRTTSSLKQLKSRMNENIQDAKQKETSRSTRSLMEMTSLVGNSFRRKWDPHFSLASGRGPNKNVAMQYTCEGALNAMAVNKDATKAAVVGRSVFRIVNIGETSFTDGPNLRGSRSSHSHVSPADVAWNHMEENIIASASTNGSVVIWNLAKPGRNKQEHVFNCHTRSVNRVCFHTSEAHLLLSGATDGSMLLFDLRAKKVSNKFAGQGTESVRDVQFRRPATNNYFGFGATYDNGSVQLWDIRRTDRCEQHFTAHSGPSFSIDWHPEDRNLLATGGRDRMVKVWNVNHSPARLVYSLQTIASVARVRWRPQRYYHIASCSLLLDHSIHIWDVRRPYIPFASFEEHHDVVTSILWLDDPHTFMSTGKDSQLIQHIFQDAKRPADKVVPAGVAVSIKGDICHAYGDKCSSGKAPDAGASRGPFFRSKTPGRNDLFIKAKSSLVLFPNLNNELLDMEWFVMLATEYKLTGMPLDKLCEHNALAAEKLRKPEISNSWRLMRTLFSKHSSQALGQTHLAQPPAVTGPAVIGKGDGLVEKGMTKSPVLGKTLSNPLPAAGDGSSLPFTNSLAPVAADSDGDPQNLFGDGTSGNSDDDSEEEGDTSEVEKIVGFTSGLTDQTGDFFFGDGEAEIVAYSLDVPACQENPQEWTLPPEAFQPRHEIMHDKADVAMVERSHESLPPLPPESAEPRDNHAVHNADLDIQLVLTKPEVLALPEIDYTPLFVETLTTFAEEGDVQTPVSMVIVLGDRARNLIEEQVLDCWFNNYIDLLHRFSLFTVASQVIKLSQLPNISQLSQQSTSIRTLCHRCSKPVQRVGWICDKCRAFTNICSICHLPVKSLFVWCQGCCHGGHLNHMQEWFSKDRNCPSGCGHQCEYT